MSEQDKLKAVSAVKLRVHKPHTEPLYYRVVSDTVSDTVFSGSSHCHIVVVCMECFASELSQSAGKPECTAVSCHDRVSGTLLSVRHSKTITCHVACMACPLHQLDMALPGNQQAPRPPAFVVPFLQLPPQFHLLLSDTTRATYQTARDVDAQSLGSRCS